ncbi:alpha-amylase family protein [Rhizobium leucaenae]|uniref:Maltose alpha-D-glucosyltransferase/alpha-amylase n=1 Tax=Rhizobium leucaenae TaxID=29450 RepID=A0A7W7EIJ8_9HYPH|nr:alpha-amylase family protein [Rhizobium leucaenae]MBB4566835.1 maltose alpha-D-glucosyltransferase/alpha-amylase [Rhizobium leucaenae]
MLPNVGRSNVIDLWYKNCVIYSLNVGTFMDSDGDGIGDFKGLTDQLDYIARLGVTCLWLLPFYPSPGMDYGYDVTDYYNIAPELGTLGDFVEFSHQARLRGLKLIIDLPINHTSEQHPWFQQARSDPRSPFRDYYNWSKTKPANVNHGMAFPGHQSSVWTYDPLARAWYYHRFYPHQPDLNISNPAVREEIFKIVGFWLELGVSGFRIDAAPFLVEEISPDRAASRDYEFFGELRDFLSWRRGDAVLIAEANVPPKEMPQFFGGGSRLHMLFAFLANQYLFLALASNSAAPLARGLTRLPKLPQLCQWVQFLRNHDELDLGRLTEKERNEVYDAFAPDADMRLYGRGIRRRLAPMLRNERRRIEMAFSLMFSLPGIPVIYYGDELGFGDELCLPERWPVRTCMQWSDNENAGFSTCAEEYLIHPVVMTGDHGADKINVETQQRDPESLLNWVRRLVDTRQSCPEVGWGKWNCLETDNPAVFAQKFTWEQGTVLIVHNLAPRNCRVKLDLGEDEAEQLAELLGNRVYPEKKGSSTTIELDAYGYRWFRSNPSTAA